jgi:hypothetical protein
VTGDRSPVTCHPSLILKGWDDMNSRFPIFNSGPQSQIKKRAYGLMGSWAYGLMGSWAYGLMGLWAHGLVSFVSPFRKGEQPPCSPFCKGGLGRIWSSPPCKGGLGRIWSSPPCKGRLGRIWSSPPCKGGLGGIFLLVYKPISLLCLLCFVFCCPLASAQEAEESAEKVRVRMDAVESEDYIEVITDADELDAEAGEVDADSQDRSGRERRSERFQQDGQPPRWRPGQERGMRGESPEGFQPDGERAGRPQRMRRGQRGTPGDEGLNRYLETVVKKNLFLPLGTGQQEKRSSFALTAVISNTSNGPDSKAIIEQRGGGRSYYVSEGDTFADEIEVVDIDAQVVTLDRSGEEEKLRLGEGTQGGPGGGRRGGGRPGPSGGSGPGAGREQGGGQRGFDPSRLPEPFRRELERRGISMDQLQSDPDLQNRLRREMMERFGGGRARQVIRLENGRAGQVIRLESGGRRRGRR